MARSLKMALLVAAVGLPVAAHAQTTVDQNRTETRIYESNTTPSEDIYGTEHHNKGPGSSVGVMADIGGGDYNRNLQSEVGGGVAYGARIDVSPQRNLGLELQYSGGVNDLNSRFSTDGRLVTNQVGGNLRVNLVPPSSSLPLGIKPFLFGGGAYHRIDTDNFTPGIADNINAWAIPAGAGLEADIGQRFLVGARYTYNFIFNEQDKMAGRNTDFWAVTANLGTRLGSP